MAKSKRQVLDEIYRDHTVERYVNKMASESDLEFYDDIVGELYLMLCELPAKTVEEIYNGCGKKCFQRYVYCIIEKQVKSANSIIYRKYKRHKNKNVTGIRLKDMQRVVEIFDKTQLNVTRIEVVMRRHKDVMSLSDEWEENESRIE